MTGLIVLVVWLTGVLLAIRPMLRRSMSRMVCAKCGCGWMCDHGSRGHTVVRVVRGSKFDRSDGDVMLALWNSVWWPVWLPLRIVGKVLLKTWDLFSDVVIAAVPLTTPELDRRIADQSAEIDRLTRKMEEG